MLRVSLFASLGLHFLILSLVSVFVSPQERQPAPPEQRFKVEFTRQKVAANSTQTDERLNSAPRKTIAEPLQRQTDFSPPITATQKRQQSPVNSPQIRFFNRPATPQVVVPPPTFQRQPVLTPPDFVAAAQAFPTPIPTPKPTPVPTQKPAPQPTARPTAIPTQQQAPMPTIAPAAAAVRQIPAQSATPATTASMPVSSHSQPQESTQSVQTQRMRQENSETEREQAIEAQPAPDVLQRYLQQVVKKIDARKAYPRQARSKGWQGTVVIKIQILSDGKVAQLELATHSEYDTLNKAALEAIKKAQPFPKFPDEIKNPSLTINIPVQFTLK
ncbi:TonB family protein [Candidatus Vecturithrix granuli]|uniref:TonB family protein n=1 Tax=Vecturithrix granuli TaxID=1499967 RepID=A0A081C518_VECG1|nr:TonB family protein [Candidatus Vecturithrix granuli]